MQTTPVSNDGLSYIMGFELSTSMPEFILVKEGQCRDSTNINDIVLKNSNSIWIKKVGAWGLDTGVIEVKEVYYVYAISDSFKNNQTAAILSLSSTGPILPGGYNEFRRIGAVLTDASAEIVPFYQVAGENSTQRHMMFDDAIEILTGGQSAEWAPVSFASHLPIGDFMAHIIAEITPNAAGDLLHLRRFGSVSTLGSHQISGVVAGVIQREYIYMPTYQSKIDYFISNALGTVDIYISGYLDSL
jgi:hypothetical protein